MHLPAWQRWIRALLGRPTDVTRERRRRPKPIALGLIRLEERRVLDGAAVAPPPVAVTSDQEGVVVVDLGQGDGSADVFEVVREEADGEDLLQVKVNGSVVYQNDFNQVSSVTFKGSSDQETLIVDFGGGGGPTGGIHFVGESQNLSGAGDILLLQHGTFDTINYGLSGPGEGQIQFVGGSQASLVTYSGTVSQILDTTTAASRSFDIAGEIAQLGLQTGGQAGTTRVAVGQNLQVEFQNPDASLVIHDHTSGPLAINVAGVGSGFDANLTISGQPDAMVHVTSSTNVGTGSIDISAGKATVDSSLQSLSGTIEISAYESLVVSHSGSVTTPGGSIRITSPQISIDGTLAAVGGGGTIRVDAGDNGTLLVTGRIDASSQNANEVGGSIDLLGRRVGLDGQAVVDVSGGSGGGTLRIGGGFAGADPDARHAQRTFVGSNVTLRADATSSGNGGRIVVWSDQATWFLGDVSARGGSSGGNGGFVEISGAQSLVARGSYDLGATRGARGTLLFDPLDILIVGGSADGSDNTDASATNLLNDAGSNIAGSILFGDEGAGAPNPFIIYESEIENTNANIVLEAGRSISVSGTFTDGSLTIQTDRNLTLRTRNAAADGAGGIDLTGSTSGASLVVQTQGTGTITVEASTSGEVAGNVVLSSLTTAGGSVSVTSSNGSVTFAGAVQSGTLTASATAGITVSADITAGAVTLNADSNADGTGALTVSAGADVATGGNALSITAADLDLAGTLSSGAATTTLQATNNRTIGIGAATGQFALSGAELQSITAGTLTIGGLTTGNITVDGVTNTQSAGVGTVNLQATGSGRSLTFSGTASTFNALTGAADNGITVGTDLTTTVGSLSLNGNADGSDSIQFGAGVIVASSGSLSLQSATGGMTGAGALTLLGNSGITLSNALTTAGALTINADNDANGTGTLTVASGVTVSTGGNSIGITAADLDLVGTLNSGAATTTLLATNNRTLGVGAASGQFTLSGAELQNITAGTLTVGGVTTGNITVDGVTAVQSANVGTLDLQATGSGTSLMFSGSASTFNALTGAADNGISVGTSLTTTVDGLSLNGNADGSLDGSDSIQFSSGVVLISAGSLSLQSATGGMTGAGTLTLQANTGITLSNSLTTAGALTINADNDANGTGTLTVASGAVVSTGGTALGITAADLDLSGTLNSGAGTTTLQATNNRTIGVGAATGQFTLSGAELQNITATILIVGGTTTGSITVDGVTGTQSANVGTLTLQATGTGRTLTFSGSASTFNALSGTANSGISVGTNLTSTVSGLALSGTTGIQFAAGVQVVSAANLSLSSTSTGAGSLVLQASGGITVNNSLTTAGSLTIHADAESNGVGTLTVAAGATVSTTSNALDITAAELTLTGNLNSGTATTTIQATRSVGLGLTAATMTISGGELQRTTAGALTIKSGTNQNLTVNGITGTNSANIAGTLTLQTTGTGTLSFSTGASTFRTLTGTSENGINVNVNLTTTVDGLSLDGNADNAPDSNDAIAFASGVILTSAGTLSLQSSVGGMTGTGALTLQAGAGVTLGNDLTTAGILTINADSNADGTGTLSVASGATVSTGGSALSITAADLDLSGSLNSGAATTTLQATSNRTIGIGAAGGQYTLSGAELQRITAGTLTIGGLTTGNITVDGVTSTESANVGSLNLQATGSGRSLTFSGSASSFKTLTGSADNGIVVGTNLTTTVDGLSLNGNADGAPDGTDAIQFAAGVVLSSTGSLSLQSATGGMTGAGVLTLQANAGITLSNDLTTAGILSINADNDGDGTGTLTVASGAAVATGGNDLDITAADLALSGTLNSGAATTTLQTTNNRTIGIGAASGQFTLSGAELQNITGGQLIVGGSTNGNITVASVTVAQSTNISLVDLQAQATGATIVFNGTQSTFKAIGAAADGDLTVNADLTVTVGNIDLTSNGIVTINDMLRTGPGSGGVLTVLGGVVLNDGVSLGGGNVTLIGGGLDIIVNTDRVEAARIDLMAERDIIVQAWLETTIPSANIQLIADTDHDGLGGVWIQSTGGVHSDGSLLIEGADLFATGGGSGPLDSIRIDGDGINVQASAAGDVTLRDNGFAPVGAEVVIEGRLQSNGSGSIDISSESVIRLATEISAGSGSVEVHSPVVLTGASQIVTTSGDILFDSAATIDSDAVVARDLTITSTSGQVVFGGAVGASQALGQFDVTGARSIREAAGVVAGQINWSATGDIQLDGGVTADGLVTFLADSDADGAGTFSVGGAASVSTNNHALSITAADINLQGTLNSGTATTSIAATAGRTIGLGTATGGMTLSNAELQKISAGDLGIGGLTTGSIFVGGLTAADTAGITGTTNLLAQADDAQIVFQSSASVFGTLVAEADDGILINVDLSTNAGNLSLQGNRDGGGDSFDAIRFAAGVATRSAGALDLRSPVGGLIAQGALALAAAGDITLHNDLSSPGALAITADSDASGAGQLIVPTGVSITTASQLLTITAADIDLQGTLSSGSAGLTLKASTTSATLGVGQAADFSVSQAELSRIIATTGLITIGDETNQGGLGVAGSEAVNLGSKPLRLVTGADLTVGASDVTTTGNLTLIADGDGDGSGGITNAGGRVHAALLTVSSGSGIDLLTEISQLDAANSQSGNVSITETDALQINRLSQAGTGTVSVTTGGTLTIAAGQPGVTGADGAVTFTALGDDSDILVNASVETTGGGIALLAGRDVRFASTGSVTSQSGAVTIRADEEAGPNGGELFMADGSVIDAGTGNVTLVADGNVTLGHVVTTNQAEITSESAGIIDGGDTGGPNLTATTAALRSRSGIGSGNALETSIGTLALSNDRTGSVEIADSSGDRLHIGEVDGLVGAVLSGSTPALLQISHSGALQVDRAISNQTGGDLRLTTTSGNIPADMLIAASVSATGAGNVHLYAGNTLIVSWPGGFTTVVAALGTGRVDARAGLHLVVGNGTEIRTTSGGIFLAANQATGQTGGEIIMHAGGQVDGGLGEVRMVADGNVSVSQVLSQDFVSITSDHGAIVDSGTQAGPDILTPELVLRAAKGIGHGDPLETAVLTLAAQNSSSGHIRIANTLAVPELTIGDVQGVSGIKNTGGGNIEVTTSANLTVNSKVAAFGGGSIHLNAANDLILNDTGSTIDISTDHGGEIFGNAGNVVTFGQNVILETGNGSASTLNPTLINVFAGEITAEGIATLTGEFGDAGSRTFHIIIDWSDGTFDDFYVENPGNFSVQHKYTANPNAENPSAPIPISVTVIEDERIHLLGGNQGPVTVPINETDTRTTENLQTTINTVATVPGEGLEFIRIDTSLKIPTLLFPPPSVLVYTPDSEPNGTAAGDLENSVILGRTEAQVESRLVFLEVLDADGKTVQRIPLDERELDDLPALFRRLPDGHYRLQLKEPGERRVRLLLDIELRGGKPASDSEGLQDKPPSANSSDEGSAESSTPQTDISASPAAEDEPSVTANSSLAGLHWQSAAATADVHSAPVLPDAAVTPQEGPLVSVDVTRRPAGAFSAAVLGGAVVSTLLGRRNWGAEVAALLEVPSNEMSQGARLARKLRRQAAPRENSSRTDSSASGR